MPKFFNDVDVDVNEFLGSCSKKEIEEIIKSLTEESLIFKKQMIKEKDEDWIDGCYKLLESKFKLTVEEEEIIKKIINRL